MKFQNLLFGIQKRDILTLRTGKNFEIEIHQGSNAYGMKKIEMLGKIVVHFHEGTLRYEAMISSVAYMNELGIENEIVECH